MKQRKNNKEKIEPFNSEDPQLIVSIRELKDLSKTLKQLSERVDYLLANIKKIKK